MSGPRALPWAGIKHYLGASLRTSELIKTNMVSALGLSGMACFIAPLVAGIAVSILSRVWKGAEKLKLSVLFYLLLGGSTLLALEHAWHGEVVLYPPFLTGASDVAGMLTEVVKVGGSMTLAVSGLWLSVLYASKRLELRARPVARVATTLGERAG